MSGADKSRRRSVKLLCPSLSNKIISFAASDDQRLDLGSIARTFGLEPSTLKLNGHFISRGLDFVSPYVTWRSLLNFFSAKGLSTGKHDHDALIVDGELSNSKSRPRKRGYEDEPEDRKSVMENKKLSSGCEDVDQVRLKRKQALKDFSLLKRLKISETEPDVESSVSSGKVRCSLSHCKKIRWKFLLKKPHSNFCLSHTMGLYFSCHI